MGDSQDYGRDCRSPARDCAPLFRAAGRRVLCGVRKRCSLRQVELRERYGLSKEESEEGRRMAQHPTGNAHRARSTLQCYRLTIRGHLCICAEGLER